MFTKIYAAMSAMVLGPTRPRALGSAGALSAPYPSPGSSISRMTFRMSSSLPGPR
jgi:hypothetical protein